MKVFAIANLEQPPGTAFFDRLAELCAAAVDLVLIRDRVLPDRDRLSVALECRRVVVPPTRMLVHGRADLALASGADGVHLPSDGVPARAVRTIGENLLVGRSAHSVDECRGAAEEKLDYVLLGPVFPTRSKAGEARISREELERAATLGPAVFALGGISLENLGQLHGLPIAGVAAITLFMEDRPVSVVVEAVRRI